MLAGTAIPSLPLPFAYIPLMLICGVLVMNRVHALHGALWLVLSGAMLESFGTAPGRLLAYVCSAVVGSLLAERVFATRSVYALIGLGACTGTVFVAVAWLHRYVLYVFSGQHTVGMSTAEGGWTVLFLLAGLYLGFVAVVTFRRFVTRTFVVR